MVVKGSKNGHGNFGFRWNKNAQSFVNIKGRFFWFSFCKLTLWGAFCSFVLFCLLENVSYSFDPKIFLSHFWLSLEAGVVREGRGKTIPRARGLIKPQGEYWSGNKQVKSRLSTLFLLPLQFPKKNTWAIDHKRHGLKQVTQYQTYRPRCKRFTIAEPQRSFWITIFVEKGSQ